MKSNTRAGFGWLIIIVIIAIALILTVLWYGPEDEKISPSLTENSTTEISEDAMTKQDGDATTKTPSETEADASATSVTPGTVSDSSQTKTPPAPTTPQNTEKDSSAQTLASGTYENYQSSKLALAENGSVVLFFHASWCPTCRALESNINSNINSIPDGVHILKTNYDTETALKQKYAVTYQHTLVQVDSRGNLIKKWTGSPSLSSIVAEIK